MPRLTPEEIRKNSEEALYYNALINLSTLQLVEMDFAPENQSKVEAITIKFTRKTGDLRGEDSLVHTNSLFMLERYLTTIIEDFKASLEAGEIGG